MPNEHHHSYLEILSWLLEGEEVGLILNETKTKYEVV